MSICTRVIVTVSFHKIDCTPDSKTCSKCDYKCLQCSYCALKKCHVSIPPKYFFVIYSFLCPDQGGCLQLRAGSPAVASGYARISPVSRHNKKPLSSDLYRRMVRADYSVKSMTSYSSSAFSFSVWFKNFTTSK